MADARAQTANAHAQTADMRAQTADAHAQTADARAHQLCVPGDVPSQCLWQYDKII